MSKQKYILISIIVLAFFLRLAGLNYGLPLWLNDDEAAFPLAALKMIQLKTVFPAAHFEEFKSVLYYPPYISYLYLPFFAIFIGIKYLFYSGAQFADYLGADLSGFFIIARLINILLATASVYLVYQVTKIFGSPTSENFKAALAAAFLLATSLIHAALSMTGKHWLPVSFILTLGLYFLTRLNWSFKKRYVFTGLLAGLGMGVSSLAGFLTILMILCALFYDRKSIKELARENFLYAIVGVFILLALLPGWLYPGSYGYGVDVTAKESKNIAGLLASPFIFLKPVLLSEPILLFLAILGLVALAKKNWRLSLIFMIFWIIYSGAFYWVFRYEHRFVLPLIPLMAILGGYGIWQLYGMVIARSSVAILHKWLARSVVIIIFILPFTASIKLAYLAYKNDSRTSARQWAEENLPAGEKIIVNARLTRLSTTPLAAEEQKKIQENSLRRADVSEAALGGNPFYKSFHVLNLFTVTDEGFYADFEGYIKENKYRYLILSLEDFQKNEEFSARWQKLAESGEGLAVFGESDKVYSLSGGYFGNLVGFFKLKQFGPPIGIYKLM